MKDKIDIFTNKCKNKYCYMRNRITEYCTVYTDPWNNLNCDVKKLYDEAVEIVSNGLVELDEDEVYKELNHVDFIITYRDAAKAICAKFGRKKIDRKRLDDLLSENWYCTKIYNNLFKHNVMHIKESLNNNLKNDLKDAIIKAYEEGEL